MPTNQYTGSTFLIKKKKAELFAEQIEALTSVFEEVNNRPVQRLNDRLLAENSTPQEIIEVTVTLKVIVTSMAGYNSKQILCHGIFV